MERLQISIPKPCHQDWNQMTPDERGRFCSMCKKTVLDFSEKTDEEILDFINSHRNENLCGRFRKDQLEHFSRIELPMPVYRSPLSFINAFLVALLFCFGTALFSCNVPHVPLVVGKVEAQQTEIQEKNIQNKNERMLMGDTIISTQYVSGGFIIPEKHIPHEKGHMKGKMAIESPYSDKIDSTIDLAPVDITASAARLIDGSFTVGALMVHDDFYTEGNDSVAKAKKDDLPPGQETFFTSVYPNPSNGLVNLKLQLIAEQNVQMDLYDLSGRLVRNLVPAQLMQAEQRTMQVDISDQPPGIYFLRISAGDKVRTERVVIAGR